MQGDGGQAAQDRSTDAPNGTRLAGGMAPAAMASTGANTLGTARSGGRGNCTDSNSQRLRPYGILVTRVGRSS